MGQWTKSEVARLIREGLEPAVAASGFRSSKKADGFARKIAGGRQDLSIALTDYNPIFDFSLSLCLRFEAVQDLVNRFSGSLPKYHDITLSSITQLEFLGLPAEGGRVAYRVESEAELAAVLPGVAAMVKERVVPFFDQHQDVTALNRGLNPEGAERITQRQWPPDRRAFDATNEPYRAMTGVAVAHLAGDPRLEGLIAAYRAQIAGLRAQDSGKLEALVEHLRS